LWLIADFVHWFMEIASQFSAISFSDFSF